MALVDLCDLTSQQRWIRSFCMCVLVCMYLGAKMPIQSWCFSTGSSFSPPVAAVPIRVCVCVCRGQTFVPHVLEVLLCVCVCVCVCVDVLFLSSMHYMLCVSVPVHQRPA